MCSLLFLIVFVVDVGGGGVLVMLVGALMSLCVVLVEIVGGLVAGCVRCCGCLCSLLMLVVMVC